MLPLSSYTVIEISTAACALPQRIALAMAGKIARDLGARVISVHALGRDPLRDVPVEPYETSRSEARALAAFLNSAKEAIVLEADERLDGERIAALVASADAVLIAKGDGDSLAVKAPVTIEIAALPPEIPMAVPPSELGLLAMSGMLDIVGNASREPLMLGGHQAAYAAGYAVFSAMMTGLAEREFLARDAHLVVDMLNVLVWLNWKALAAAETSQGETVTREGDTAIWQVVPCADGHVAIVYNDRDLPEIAKLIGYAASAFKDSQQTADSRRDFLSAVKVWCATRSRCDITEMAQQRRIPFGPVLLPHELAHDAHLGERGSFTLVSDGGRSARLPLLPLRWDGRAFHPVPQANPLSSSEAAR